MYRSSERQSLCVRLFHHTPSYIGLKSVPIHSIIHYALPELTDAERQSASCSCVLPHPLPDRPDLAEDLAENHAFRLPRCRRFSEKPSGQLVLPFEKQNYRLPAPNQTAARVFARLRKMLDEIFEERFASDGHWTADGHPQTGLARKRWTTKSFVKSCNLYQMPKTPPACLP